MKIRVFNIDYDVDGIIEVIDGLPKEFVFEVENTAIEMDGAIDDELADMISDRTGWCVNSFNYIKL